MNSRHFESFRNVEAAGTGSREGRWANAYVIVFAGPAGGVDQHLARFCRAALKVNEKSPNTDEVDE